MRVVTAALIGLALTITLPAWAEGQVDEPVQTAVTAETQAPAGAMASEARIETRATETGERSAPPRYRVGARIEGMYRFAHPYGVPPQVIPFLPADFTGFGF